MSDIKNDKQNKTEYAKREGKVLQFEQDGEFFYKRGLDLMDKNNLFDAMAQYQRALALDPQNDEIKLSIAELFTEMSRFEDSNRILLPMASASDENKYVECYFGLGCNFIGLQEYKRAAESLEFYLSSDPDGDYVFDALDMLDAIDESGLVDESEPSLIPLNKHELASINTEKGRSFLEHEKYDEAIGKLKEAIKSDPKHTRARNYLAIAHLCNRDYDAGLREVEKTLAIDPDNISAICNKAMIMNAKKDENGIKSAAEELEKHDTQDTDELARKALVLMELLRFASAYDVMKRLLSFYPYDTLTIHRTAVCAYEMGKFRKAMDLYGNLLKLNPNDTIARYYRGICRAAAAGGEKRKMIMYNYQVPFDEMLARVNRLNEYLNRPPDEMKKLWENGTELSALIEWGFTLSDVGIKRAMLSLASSFEDKKAELILRDFALCRKQPDELKNEVFALLARMGAEEPYVGYIGDELVESKVGVADALLSDIPKSYRDALELCFSQALGERSDACMMEIIKQWAEYMDTMDGNLPRLNKQQAIALIAAIEYNACVTCGEKTTKAEICHKYGVTMLRLKNATAKLERAKEKNEIHSDV